MARSGGRRSSRRERSKRLGFHQLPWRNLVNPYAPIEVLSADQVEQIHLCHRRQRPQRFRLAGWTPARLLS